MKSKNGLYLIKVGSHRASGKLKRLLNREIQFHFSFFRKGQWITVNEEELKLIKDKKIKGVTQSVWTDCIQPCIKW